MSALQVAPVPPAARRRPGSSDGGAYLEGRNTDRPTTERLFTLAQIQVAGGFSRSTLFRLRHGGGLRVVTVGGLVRVRERDWLAWLDKNAAATIEGGDNV